MQTTTHATSVDRAPGAIARALDHYCAYLPQGIARWGIVFDSAFHRDIVAALVERIADPILLDLRRDPEAVARFGGEHRRSAEFGVLGFLTNQPAFDTGYTSVHENALALFNNWPVHRTKVCFEVWDGNFASLFADNPRDLQRRCLAMLMRVTREPQLTFSAVAQRRADLVIGCAGTSWITQTGFEERDYILPTGEIATCPTSLDGVVALDGWVIGTLPLGSKYGRISPGELDVWFEHGEIVSIGGKNQELRADLELLMSWRPALRQVSEAGIGMSRAIANTARTHTAGHLWHERHLGFHIGLGARIPETGHADSDHLATTGPHLDLVFAHGALRASDGSELLAW